MKGLGVCNMARICVKRSRKGYCVTIAGYLGATDLRRLERACGPALERRSVALQLDMAGMTGSDAVSDAFVGRLLERGARILNSRPGDGSHQHALPSTPPEHPNES